MKSKRVTITSRDRELFELLVGARWLTTRQVHRQFFASRSVNAVNKRLRKLATAGFLSASRPSRTAEMYVRLGPTARSLLSETVTIPKRLPMHLDHFRRINDIRLWFLEQHKSQGLPLNRFAAEWELKDIGQTWPLVPDGVALLTVPHGRIAVAVEVDCGTEPVGLIRNKILRYLAEDSRFQSLLIGAPGWRRLRSFIRGLYDLQTGKGPTWFLVDLDRLGEVSVSMRAFIVLNRSEGGQESMLASVARDWGCPDWLSGREDSRFPATANARTSYDDARDRDYAAALTRADSREHALPE